MWNRLLWKLSDRTTKTAKKNVTYVLKEWKISLEPEPDPIYSVLYSDMAQEAYQMVTIYLDEDQTSILPPKKKNYCTEQTSMF